MDNIPEAPVERQAAESPEPGAPFNPVESVIFNRRSVRLFRKRQVPEALVRRVLEAGRFAPSAGNAQPWRFVVIQDPGMLRQMTEDVVKVCKRVMKVADYTEEGKQGRQWRARSLQRLLPNMFHPIPFGAMKLIAEGKLGVWHGAPTVIALLVDMRAPGKPLVDAGIAGQNMVLAAHSLGLGSCWVSFIEPLANMPRWRKKLGVRFPFKLVSSIALGFPRGDPDGEVRRETHAVPWYGEDGAYRVIY